MNFISHYFIDRELDDSLFVVGVCTPDLLSIFNRNVRLNEREIHRLFQGDQVSEHQMSFAQGVIRHFQVDKLFHSSRFFHEETRLLSKQLRDEFTDSDIKRTFFVAHVLLELVLDKLLIHQDEKLLAQFYDHFSAHDASKMAALTAWLAQTELPSYENFLRNFVADRHLYHYTDWTYIVYVLKRILRRVGISEYNYLNAPAFMDFLERYEASLALRQTDVQQEMAEKLAKEL